MPFALSTMQLRSDAFTAQQAIPAEYSKELGNHSPQLQWSDAPAETAQYIVFCHDPDAPLIERNGAYGFVHWVLYNIPSTVNNIEKDNTLYTSGKNSYGELGYGGPRPPEGHGCHQYYFWVVALKDSAQFEPNLTLWQLLAAAEPDIIAMNRLVGTFQR